MSRLNCALNGVSLASLDPRIHVTDVIECAPAFRLTNPCPHQPHRTREKLTVQVRFRLLEQDVTARRTLMQRVLAWADGGGALSTLDRPGQRLQVLCESLPAMSALDWTEEMTLSFAALADPYWVDEAAVRLTADASGILSIPGNAGLAPVDVTIVNTGDTAITSLGVAAALTAMVFEGIDLPAGGAFTLRTEGGVPSAKVGSASVLMNRTSDSADLLLAPCGADSAVFVTAASPVSATFSARGRYL